MQLTVVWGVSGNNWYTAKGEGVKEREGKSCIVQRLPPLNYSSAFMSYFLLVYIAWVLWFHWRPSLLEVFRFLPWFWIRPSDSADYSFDHFCVVLLPEKAHKYDWNYQKLHIPFQKLNSHFWIHIQNFELYRNLQWVRMYYFTCNYL